MPTGVWPVAAVVGEFMVKLALIGYILLRRPARPASNLAWITVILAIPVLGVIAYLFVGEVRLSRRRIDRHAEIRTRLQRDAPVHRAERPAVDDRFRTKRDGARGEDNITVDFPIGLKIAAGHDYIAGHARAFLQRGIT